MTTAIAPETAQELSADIGTRAQFLELKALVTAKHLLDRRHGYYIRKIATTLLLFFGGWASFFLLGASWWNIFVTAVFLAVMYTQVAFIGHDAGHRQIWEGHKANHRLSLFLGNFLLCMGTGWWFDKHNRHHSDPNKEGSDPDVAGGGPISWTAAQAAKRAWLGTLLTRSQAFLFFPMLLLEGFNLHYASFRAMFGDAIPSMRMRVLETVLMLAHITLYLGAVFYVLNPLQGIVFIAVHQCMWGLYMGISFAPNHKGMELVPANGKKRTHMQKQIPTSRNIEGGPLTDIALGGLNYQIEHHLWPRMPRCNLRFAQLIVEAYCRKIGMPYAKTSFRRSYGQVLRYLHSVGRNLGRKRGANA